MLKCFRKKMISKLIPLWGIFNLNAHSPSLHVGKGASLKISWTQSPILDLYSLSNQR